MPSGLPSPRTMSAEVLCYNRGCGKTFTPGVGQCDEECAFHPGAPYFHDAYKGWTCCNRKSTDFTEFLNFPGCTRGRHSRVKPKEPENITGNLSKVDDVPEEKERTPVRVPLSAASKLPRPSLESPMTRMEPNLAKSLTAALDKSPLVAAQPPSQSEIACIPVGESCKNGGCKARFTGDPAVDDCPDGCRYHPGSPIFHEGMKYWSCCQRKTSDFQSFLNQEGCQTGRHVWTKKDKTPEGDRGDSSSVNCRYDWHQTATTVTVAIYGKRYDPWASSLQLSPVRLRARVEFPEEPGFFELDLALCGLAKVEESKASMFGTKLEVVLRKAEAGSWAKLGRDLGEEKVAAAVAAAEAAAEAAKEEEEGEGDAEVDVLDLDDLELSGEHCPLRQRNFVWPPYL